MIGCLAKMNEITKREFEQLYEIESKGQATELQSKAFWRQNVAGRMINWQAYVSSIQESENGIEVWLTVILPNHSISVFFTARNNELEHYLTFPTQSKVMVAGRLPNEPALKNYVGLLDGKIEHLKS